jgi:hypothetical protein
MRKAADAFILELASEACDSLAGNKYFSGAAQAADEAREKLRATLGKEQELVLEACKDAREGEQALCDVAIYKDALLRGVLMATALEGREETARISGILASRREITETRRRSA